MNHSQDDSASESSSRKTNGATDGGGFENAAFVPDCASGSVDSGDSFMQELQQYRLVSANGRYHQSSSTSTAVLAHQTNLHQQQQQQHDAPSVGSSAATELSLLGPPKPLPFPSRSAASGQGARRLTGRIGAMPVETKLRLQRLLRQNAGVLRHDSTSILLGVCNVPPGQLSSKELDKRFSAVAMEMLREQEDRDLHPFGRGGRFEGVLYSRRVKVQVDHTKFLAWIVFASFILLTSGAIIFLAEMERRQKSQQATSSTTTVSTIDGLLKANGTG